jgi:carbon monoxide dehydrogenase subunit G
MKLENSFDVSASPEAAWGLLMDVPRVIPCMPGAELVETVDESNWKARMRVKLGPISLSFLTDVSFDEVDEAARRVRLAAKAREERGRGAASATIESTLSSAEGKTRVTTVTDLTLSGAAAQYGRGLVQGVTEQLLKSFAECLEQQLAPAAAAVGGATPAAGAAAAAPAQPRPVSGLALAAAALRSSLARFFRRLTRR